MNGRRRALALAALLVAASLTGPASTATPAVPATAAGVHTPTVVGKQVIGHSVQGRPIVAYHLGQTQDAAGHPTRTVLLIAEMHGNEQAPHRIMETLIDGRPIGGVDLWIVPTYNPDGVAAGTRRNAHGVDLNRNYPYHWTHLTGNYYSGPHAASEPETRAMMGFLKQIRPDFILSFHQPLDSVDTDTKNPRFATRVARLLHLPRSSLDCGGVCHGTMTGWFNSHFAGAALTVEYGTHPGRHRMAVDAPRAILRIFHADHGQTYAEPWP